MKNDIVSGEKPLSTQTPKKLAWERLYDEEHCSGYVDEWGMEIDNFNQVFPHHPDQTNPPITLELLASTATALRPMFGAEGLIDTAEGKQRTNALAAKQAYELLSECVYLLERAKFKEEKLALLKKAFEERVLRHQEDGGVRLNAGVQRITERANPQDAQPRFKAFLEVFYGEVLYYHEHEAGRLVLEPWMPGVLGTERGRYKDWAANVYAKYEAVGFCEEEVVFYTEKFKKLHEMGFLKKSTPRSLSRTKAKKRKQKTIVS